MQDFFNSLTEHHRAGLPFVAYRKPDDNTIQARLQKDTLLHLRNQFLEPGFVMAPFHPLESAVFLSDENCERIQTTYIPETETLTFSESTIPHKNESVARKHHLQLVTMAIEAICRRSFKKVVLSRREIVPLLHRWEIVFRNMLHGYPKAFCYVWYHPETGMWAGATPEILLQAHAGKFYTMALAGTQKFREGTPVEWGNKERQEQQIVTDYIQRQLLNLASEVHISEPQTVYSARVAHLRTNITGTISEKYLHTLVDALHPTPAVCGLPKEAALQFILRFENYPRQFYSGFLGEWNPAGITDLYVNLRCMQLESERAILYMGGGITAESNPEDEWQETVLKSLTMKQVLF